MSLLCAAVACSKAQPGSDCALDRSCPGGQTCFPDFKCYPVGADPGCSPPCYGVEPYCDPTTLRCVGCRDDNDCAPGSICVPPKQVCRQGCDAERPDCPAPGSQCDLTLRVCRGCDSDTHCTDPAQPRCTVATGLCDACAPGTSDCGSGAFCTNVGGRFVCQTGCQSDAECGDAGWLCCGNSCVDGLSDALHCGSCGTACAGNETCCDGQCANLTNDTENCAACGLSCSLPGVASPVCSNGVCSNSGCEYYFGDCDRDASNGCETNLSYNGYNCSACGHVCQAGANQVPRCTLGGCDTPLCAMGWGDCDSNFSNGCETPLDTVSTCGTCTTVCDAGQSCVGGQCR